MYKQNELAAILQVKRNKNPLLAAFAHPQVPTTPVSLETAALALAPSSPWFTTGGFCLWDPNRAMYQLGWTKSLPIQVASAIIPINIVPASRNDNGTIHSAPLSMRIRTQASWFMTFRIFDARFEGNWSRKLHQLYFLQPSWKQYWWRINCIWSVIPFIYQYQGKTICFFCGFPRKWSGEALLPISCISNGTCQQVPCVSKHLLWRCHEGNNLLVSKVGEILHCHSIWCLRIFCFGELQSLQPYMKHPLNHCSMHKVHAFSHSGEPVWYIEILRCMQFRAFCESLRATCQPGDFSQMWSRQCLFCQLVPTVDVASCWCHDRTAWVTNLNLMRITVTKTYAFRFQWKQSCTRLKEINIFWYQIITGWNIPKCLVHQTLHTCTPCFYHDFRGSKCIKTLGRWHLDFLGSYVWRVSKQGTVRFIPKIGELQGKRLFNCILHILWLHTHSRCIC